MLRSIIVLLIILALLSFGCQQTKRPNILWLTCEDISPSLSMYGDSTAKTPNLDRLTTESLIFNEAYATVGVCAPARSSLITGMHPVSIGTHNMRTGLDVTGWGSRTYGEPSGAKDIRGNELPLYATVTPPQVKCFTEYLRKEGYFCTNNAKTDYQFAAPVTAWDENGKHAHWKNRREGQPFFAVFNHEVTHESRIWKNKDLPLTVAPEDVAVPAYLPDNYVIRKDLARNYSNIELLDAQIGEKLRELEESGELDNTIIFFFSDHGGPLPRGKREHYESGLRVPFMVRIPGSLRQTYMAELVSFVDFAPTVLSLADIEIPDWMQGRAFLGEQKSEDKRKYVFGSGDRFDEYPDMVRSVISDEFLYVKNFHTDLPSYKDVTYRKNMDMMNELLRLRDVESLNDNQLYWFRETKSEEEFYIRQTDPYSLTNLIDDPRYQNQIAEMRTALAEWQSSIGDLGHMHEKELIDMMWPNGNQPKTKDPVITFDDNVISLSCETEGASIAYIIRQAELDPDLDAGWQLYHQPIQIKPGEFLYALSTRIGFQDSDVVVLR